MTMKKTIGIKRNFIIIIISILLSACTKKENASQQATGPASQPLLHLTGGPHRDGS